MSCHTPAPSAALTFSQNPASKAKPAPIPAPPEHVPEKFKAEWSSLPPCCRNFYLKPGGCCDGKAEPSAAQMKVHAAEAPNNSPVTPPAHPQKSQLKDNPVVQKSVTLAQWLRHFWHSLWTDLRTLVTGKPTPQKS